MGKRGRPKHPDILTPREWEVLALLREGRSNEEIAERLGISLAGAKYHVSEILSKLGIASREEAARWSPERRPWWAGGRAPLTMLWRKAGSSWAAGAAAVGAFVLIASGIGVLVWGLVRTEDSEQAAVIAGSPSATLVSTPTADASSLIQVDGPLTQEEALSEANLRPYALYVADLPSRTFYVVRFERLYSGEGPFVHSSVWEDDRTLLLSISSNCAECPEGLEQAFMVGLDGSVRGTTVPPFTATTPSRVFSVDGSWSAEQEPGQYSGVLITSADGNTRYRISNSAGPQWSPSENKLIVHGNQCVGHDALLFDPSTGSLVNLTDTLPVVFGLVWRPTGNDVAVGLIDNGGAAERRLIGLIDTATGRMEPIVDYQGSGGFPLRSWSPSGDRLLFAYNPGSGACEDIGPNSPAPDPSRVERLST